MLSLSIGVRVEGTEGMVNNWLENIWFWIDRFWLYYGLNFWLSLHQFERFITLALILIKFYRVSGRLRIDIVLNLVFLWSTILRSFYFSALVSSLSPNSNIIDQWRILPNFWVSSKMLSTQNCVRVWKWSTGNAWKHTIQDFFSIVNPSLKIYRAT